MALSQHTLVEQLKKEVFQKHNKSFPSPPELSFSGPALLPIDVNASDSMGRLIHEVSYRYMCGGSRVSKYWRCCSKFYGELETLNGSQKQLLEESVRT